MKQLITSTLFLFFAAGTCFANDYSEKADSLPSWLNNINFAGSVDSYWRTNLNGDFAQAPNTAFANDPGFALGMANLIAGYDSGKVGFVADLVYGPRGEDAVFVSTEANPSGSSNIINQLYVDWDISEAVTATFGNFNTFLGYEVISPVGNYNYSTSYMFSWGPFSHTGLKFDFDLGDGFSAMAGVFNQTDWTDYNPGKVNDDGDYVGDYVGGLQLGYGFDKGSIYLNGLTSEDFYQLDVTGGVDLTEDLYLGVNATTAKDAFDGVAGYLQYSFSETASLGTRVEYFDDKGTVFPFENENVLDLTLSSNIHIGNLTLIPEIRSDNLSYEGFLDEEEPTDNLASFLIAAVYGF